MKRMGLCLLALLVAGVLPATAATIREGQMHAVTGKITAVDPGLRSITVDVPRAKGDLVVGVKLEKNAKILEGGKSVGMDKLSPGERVSLSYTRRHGELVGTRVAIGPAMKKPEMQKTAPGKNAANKADKEYK